MIKDALHYLVGLAKKDRYRLVESDYRRHTVINGDTGVLMTVDKPPKPWSSTVESLTDVAGAIRRFAETELAAVTIWIGSDQIQVVFDDSRQDYRDEKIYLALQPSSIFHELTRLVNLSPKLLVETLRFNLFAASFVPENLIDSVKVLKFATEKNSEHVNSTLDASVGQSIRERVSGADQVPEEVVFSFLPFPDLSHELKQQVVDVRCFVRVNVSNETVSILPFPEQLAFAMHAAHQQLRDKLTELLPELKDSIFFGCP